jgi:hypothetical protein
MGRAVLTQRGRYQLVRGGRYQSVPSVSRVGTNFLLEPSLIVGVSFCCFQDTTTSSTGINETLFFNA